MSSPLRSSGSIVVAACLTALMSAAPAQAQGPEPGVPRDTITWANPAGGDWYEASNWSPANVPDTPWESAALKPLSGPYVVTFSTNGNIGGLRVDGGGPVLSMTTATLRIDGVALNKGTIRVSEGATLRNYYPLFQNRGGAVVAGDNGGSLLVFGPYPESPGTLDNTLDGFSTSSGGTLVSDGGDLTVYCGVIVNGEIQRASGTSAVAILMATPQNLTVAQGAELEVRGQIDLMAVGSSLINNGTVRVPGRINSGGHQTTQTVSLSGSGEVVLEEGILDTPGGGTMINAAGHTIRGCGTILANLVNEGTMEVDCPSAMMLKGSVINNSMIRSTRGYLWVTGTAARLTNVGTVTVTGGTAWIDAGATVDNRFGVMIADGRPFELGRNTSCTILGGHFAATGTGTFHVLGSVGTTTLDNVTIDAGATLRTWAGATANAIGARLLNQGTVRIDAQGTVAVGPSTDYLQTGGATVLAGGSLSAAREVQIQGGALRGIGTILADVTSAGEVSPDASAGSLTIQGDYHQLAGGSLNVGLAGPGPNQFSRLAVTGAANLEGPAEVAAIGGYDPTPGVPFEVLSFGSLTGQFSEVGGTGPAGELALVSHYDADGVDLMILGAVGVENPTLPTALAFRGQAGAGHAAFVLDLPSDAVLTLRVYDASGREVAVLANGARAAGIHRFTLADDGRSFASGVYFARAQVQRGGLIETLSARAVVLR